MMLFLWIIINVKKYNGNLKDLVNLMEYQLCAYSAIQSILFFTYTPASFIEKCKFANCDVWCIANKTLILWFKIYSTDIKFDWS